MINEFALKGVVKVTVTEADGTVVSDRLLNNIETNYTVNTLAKWLGGTPNTGVGAVVPPTIIAAGNGVGTVAATDTALWSPIPGTSKVCDSITLSQSYYAQWNLTYQASDPVDYYNEVGLFDTGGNMWAHIAINQYKSASQTLTIQWMIYVVPDLTQTAVATNFARTAIASWLTGVSNVTGVGGAIVPPTKFTVGIGSGAVSQADTTLWQPVAGGTKTCSTIVVIQGSTVRFMVTYMDSEVKGTFTEVGLVDVNNNLWVHGTLNNITKQSPNVMTLVGSLSITN